MDAINIKFVKNDSEYEITDIMLQAYDACKQNVQNVSWIEDTDLKTVDPRKTQFLIFQDFTGPHFEAVKESKCVILGPWCVLICLTEARPIPNFTWPIYNVAMLDCIVSCSHFSKSMKLDIKEKVQLMGGMYSDILLTTSTHLISDTVHSEKYTVAAKTDTKVMLRDWVDAVWKASQTNAVHCNDERFNQYRCLPFHNLVICSTGITDSGKRKNLSQLVTSNGGEFTGNLVLASTNVLICYGAQCTLSAKYKAARNSTNVHCVTIDWATDSVDRGYAMPYDLYPVKTATSTPTKDHEANPNFSTMSVIASVATDRSTIDDTINLAGLDVTTSKRKSSLKDNIGSLIDGLDIKKAKKAGQYLDGCSVYIAGFNVDQREKLCKVLNASGATRYDDLSDRLTHIIVGDPTSSDVKSLVKLSNNYACPLVSVQWLLDSIDKRQPVDEISYLISCNDIDRDTINSPLSQRGLKLLRTNVSIASNDNSNHNSASDLNNELDPENLIMQQYLQQGGGGGVGGTRNTELENDTLAQLLKNTDVLNEFDNNRDPNPTNIPNRSTGAEATLTNENASSLSGVDDSSRCEYIFTGLNIVIYDLDADCENLTDQICENGGSICCASSIINEAIPDYAIVPTFINNVQQLLEYKAKEIVNILWVSESLEQNNCCDCLYYHRPLVLRAEIKPLKNCVVTISSYCTYERVFLRDLIVMLGGIFQEQFARITSIEKNIRASTHLVSLEANGKKYQAALKWNLPVVNKDWLLECAKHGQFVSEMDFLVGAAKVQNKSDGSTSTSHLTTVSNSATFLNHPTTPQSNSKRQSITTPTSSLNFKENLAKTPINRMKNAGNYLDVCSQVTPVNKIMAEMRNSNLLCTPDTPSSSSPANRFSCPTPETPLGEFIRPNPSPQLRKEMAKYINQFPDFVALPKRRPSTPLSQLKRRFWDRLSPRSSQTDVACPSDDNSIQQQLDSATTSRNINVNSENQDEELDTQNLLINTKLKELENMLSESGGNRRSCFQLQADAPPVQAGNAQNTESQPFTVGWDYMDHDNNYQEPKPNPSPPIRIFIISGYENDLRHLLVNKLERLGAVVSDLLNYDPTCTHLICPKPARNEKTLSCMAAGKWIIHVSYVDKCIEAGKFLNEEDFEFGNPKSIGNIQIPYDKDNEQRMQSIHKWRKVITKRGYGAFNDMRAIVVAAKRDPIVRVIEAGGGVVIDVKPPFENAVHATHCLLEAKTVVDFADYVPLAQQGIYCVNTLYISDYLHKHNLDARDCILPFFSKYFDRN